jgi:ribonuclease G
MPTGNEILINHTPHETRVALTYNASLSDLHVEREIARGLVGNIYLGKVTRVLPGMQSAFMDIGLEKAAFLHVADLWQARINAATKADENHEAALQNEPPVERPAVRSYASVQHHMPIEKVLFDGKPLLVQVIKDPIGTKGARLSSQVSIAGRLLVYLPQDQHIGVSQRIGNEADRAKLKERLQKIVAELSQKSGANTGSNSIGGLILRTHAEDASDDELRADLDYLRKRWTLILQASQKQPAGSLLYRELDLSQRVARDMVNEDTAVIRIDSKSEFNRLKEFCDTYVPAVSSRLSLYQAERPLFELHSVEEDINRAMSRRVDLKSGGYLIIDQTEALTTVDVNTGGYVGGRNFDDTIFKTNLEAAHSIAKQLRIRNLGGIIIIDFIDMTDVSHRDNVLKELEKALSFDRTKTAVHGFTSLGLVELTRKRSRESLAHILCEPCPTCHGKGEIKTARTVCYEIIREIQREAGQFNPKEFRVVASQTVIDMLLEEESHTLATLGDAIGKPVSLTVETIYSQEQYDIVLL